MQTPFYLRALNASNQTVIVLLDREDIQKMAHFPDLDITNIYMKDGDVFIVRGENAFYFMSIFAPNLKTLDAARSAQDKPFVEWHQAPKHA